MPLCCFRTQRTGCLHRPTSPFRRVQGNTQTLTILLTNTDYRHRCRELQPTQPTVLTGLFFNLGTGTFTPISATLISGADATTFNATRPAADPDVKAGSIDQTAQCDVASCAGQTNVGGECSYASGGANWLNGTTQGIASSGYLSGNTSAGNFNGPNYDDPLALDGINFGVVPYGWTDYSGNGGLDTDPLIEGTVKFVSQHPEGADRGGYQERLLHLWHGAWRRHAGWNHERHSDYLWHAHVRKRP